jgi:hypothetical protein
MKRSEALNGLESVISLSKDLGDFDSKAMAEYILDYVEGVLEMPPPMSEWLSLDEMNALYPDTDWSGYSRKDHVWEPEDEDIDTSFFEDIWK